MLSVCYCLTVVLYDSTLNVRRHQYCDVGADVKRVKPYRTRTKLILLLQKIHIVVLIRLT
jgi:hypothetical protein